MTLVWFFVALAVTSTLGEHGLGWAFFTWMVGGATWVLRRELSASRIAAFAAWLVIGAIGARMVLNTAPAFVASRHSGAFPLLLLLQLGGFTVVWATTPKRAGGVPRWAWSGCSIGYGLGMLLIAVPAATRGEYWSPWDDPRTWDPYSQYPLTNVEAAWVGATITTIGLLTGFGPAIWSRVKRLRAR